MASATTRPTFCFHLSQSPKPRTNLHRPRSRTTQISISAHRGRLSLALRSTDVTKEDKPSSESEDGLGGEEDAATGFIDKRRLEEKFAVLNTGIYECRSCGHNYDESVGDKSYPIPPGLPFNQLPEDWRCPTCGAAKSFFESKSVEIAGFAQNQQFGLGGNTLTSGQKALLIYGSLLLFFALFLSGYFRLSYIQFHWTLKEKRETKRATP